MAVFLTLNDLALVDEANKQAFQSSNGYDYSNEEKQYIQKRIHDDMRYEIDDESDADESWEEIQNIFSDFRSPGGIRDSHTGIFNGRAATRTVQITSTDLDAYLAVRPYIVESEEERNKILEILRNGGSVTDDPSETPQASESDLSVYKDLEGAKYSIHMAYGPLGAHADLGRDVEREDIVIKNVGEVNPIGSGNDPSDDEDFLKVFLLEEGGRVQKDHYVARQKESTVIMTPPQPEPPTSATHKVKTVGPITFIGLEFRKITQKVSEAGSVDVGEKSKIIDMIPDKSEYILLDEGLGDKSQWNYILYNGKKGYIINTFTTPINPENHLSYTNLTSPPLANPRFSHDWTKKEIDKAYYDEKSSKQCVSVETEYDSTGGTELKERMLSARAKGLKIILESQNKHSDEDTINNILSKYISVVSEDYYIDPRPGSKMRVLVTFQQKYIPLLSEPGEEEHPAIICGTPEDRKRIVLNYNSYASMIDQAALVLESYAKKIDSFDGTVEDGDLNKDAKGLRKVKGGIAEIVRLNELSESSLKQVEIWLNTDSKACFIGENSSGDFLKMKKGMSNFTDTTPMDSPRIMMYLFFLEEIIEMKKGGLEWIEFLNTYTSNPRPKVFPSKKKDKELSSDSTSKNTTADKLEKEIDKATGSVKTVKQQLEEDKKINGDITLKERMMAEAHKARDFVGDDILKKLPETMREINNLEVLYDRILNKISLGELQSALMKCFDTPTITAQFGDVGQLSIELRPPSGNPKPPTVKFKKKKPLKHILQDFAMKIADSILSSLTSSMINLVEDIVNDLFDICDPFDAPTKINLNDLLDEILGRNDSAAVDEIDNAKLQALSSVGDIPDNLGIPIDFFGLQPQARQEVLTDINEILNELSLLLEPKELCSMLSGTASDYTMALARSLIRRKSETMSTALNTKTKIADFFITIGKFVGEDICNTLSRFPNQDRKPRIDCIDPYEAPDYFTGQMQDKGDGVTEAQIEEQLKKARKRKKNKLRRMAEIGKIIAAHENGDINPFDNLIPDFLCNEEAESDIDSFFPKPSIDLHTEEDDFMRDMVLDSVFAGPYSAFINDVSYMNYSYTEEVTMNVREDIILEIDDPEGSRDPIKIINPNLKALEAQGVDISSLVYVDGDDGPALTSFAEKDPNFGMFKREKIVKRSSESAKNTLTSLSSSNFESKYDHESVYYELILPPNRGIVDKFEKIMENIPEDQKPPNIKDQIDIMKSSLTNWAVRYKIPYQAEGTIGKVDDDYIVEIFSENNPEEGLRIIGRGEIDGEVKDFINTFVTDAGPAIAFPNSDSIRFFGLLPGSTGSTSVETSSENDDSCPPFKSSSDEVISAMKSSDTISDEMISNILNMDGDERCKATLAVKELYKAQPDKYEIAWSKLEIIYNDYCAKKETGYLPPPQSVFGKYVGHIWRTALSKNNNMSTSDVAALDIFISEIEKTYSEHAHSQISRDLITMVNDEISGSQMFQPIVSNIHGNEQETPRISLLNLASRALEKEDLECGVSNHMLDIDGFKEEAKNNIKNKDCPVKNKIKDSDPAAEDREEIELSILEPAVKMTIRAYMIDYAVRGIFPLSQFKQPESTELSIVRFFIKKMLAELAEYSQEYADEFVELAYNIYKKMKDRGEIEAEIYNSGFIENKKYIGLQALIKKIIPTVHEDIQKVVSRDAYEAGMEYEPLNVKDYLRLLWLNNYRNREEQPRGDPRIRITTGWEAQPKSYYITMALIKVRIQLARDWVVSHPYAYGENPDVLNPSIPHSAVDYTSFDITEKVLLYGMPEYDYKNTTDTTYVFNDRGRFHISDGHRKIFVASHPSVSDENMVRTVSSTARTKEQHLQDIESLKKMSLEAASHDFSWSEIYSMRFDNIPMNSNMSWLGVIENVADQGVGTDYLETILSPLLQNTMVDLINEDRRLIETLYTAMESSMHKVNYSNNNLFIEDMWVVKRRTEVEILKLLKDSNIIDPHASFLNRAFLKFWNSWSSTEESGIGADPAESVYRDIYAIKSLGKELLSQIDKTPPAILEAVTLDHFFEYISPIRRIIYSNPTDSKTDILIKDLKQKSTNLNTKIISLKNNTKLFQSPRNLFLQFEEDTTTSVLSAGTVIDNPIPLVDPSRDENYTGGFFWEARKVKPIWQQTPGMTGGSFPLNGAAFWGSDPAGAHRSRQYQEEVEQEFKNSKEFKLMFDFMFPVDRYLSFLSIYSFMAVSTVDGVEQTFVSTKDELYKMFRLLTDGAGTLRGGSANLITMKNENVHQIAQGLAGAGGSTPCPSFTFSGGFKSFKGIGFDVMLRLHMQAPMIVFKALVELIDPNIKMMKTFLNATRMIGACIPPWVLTMGLLPPSLFGFPPFGFGIGPILTPLGILYHALGTESEPLELNLLFGVDKETGKVDKKPLGNQRSMTLSSELKSDHSCDD